MDRNELLKRIRDGEKYLERDDLTDKQREAAEERYCNLVGLLATMPEETEKEPEKPQVTTTSPEIQKIIDDTWRKLDPEGKRRKQA